MSFLFFLKVYLFYLHVRFTGREEKREKVFYLLVYFRNGCNSLTGLIPILEPRAFGSAMSVQVPKHLGCPLVFPQGHYVRARFEVGQLRLELVPYRILTS